LLQHVIEGEKGGAEGRGKVLKQLLDDLKEKRGYCKLKDEALDCPCGENALKVAMGLSEDRLRDK
jgi:hypothetical protein